MTAKTLIIAEKPSVAGDLVKVLPGKFKKTKTHFESDDYIVSYAIGHLVSICYPEEINPDYQKWGMENLPILPESFPLKGLDGTKSQLNALQKLIRRKDVVEIINACDAGREGELIFKYIINYVWNNSVARKSFKRLWLQSMTTDAIKKGFDNLRQNEEMVPLEDTALCRSESDWLIGINATRALTGFNSRKGGFFLTPCGRVQTPTLSLIVKREQVRLGFEPVPYSTLTATFAADGQEYLGKWIDTGFRKDPANSYAKADRIWEPEKALAIVDKCTGKPAEVTETSKESTQRSPQLYDLTSLQREANSRFGFSAKNTLGLAQALYERHKVLTYPRTDSRNLPEDYVKTATETVKKQKGWQYGKFADEALEKGYIKKDKRIFDNKKITDHHAIMPTSLLPKELSEPELKIYQMVVQRFLAVFFPAAVYMNTRRTSIVEKETFITEGKILLNAGWKAIYGGGQSGENEKLLAPLAPDAKVNCDSIEKEDKETTPPPRYTEATLLSAMEKSDKFIDDEELADAMKERGLGTPATRAAIIEKLIKEKYIVREGKDLTPTGKAFELLSLLEAMKIEVLASPEMTGEWEYKLNQILKGQLTREKFMKEIRDLTRHIIDQIKNFEATEVRQEAPFSPVDGVKFFGSPTAWISEDEKITIRKILGGRVMSDDEIVRLIKGETLGPYSDFRSKRGKPFTASVRYNKKIEFIFADSTDDIDIEEIKKSTPLGQSPIDGSPVYETPAGYMSASALDGDKDKGLKIGKIILSKEISSANIKQLLTDGKTELIKGFISKKRKPFDAYLLLGKNGKISFEFPPRKQRKTA
ncbi:DNA topoisomerase III [Desulfosediminicola ganghwensis]|uniref:DNA topoisomerase III n=1 Tax=Desulfosediminicola ganghwensis TaxID=2569540 RepID=UPI0010AB66AC|nr:DNA topoisomerase III [Desulfosediminicola ganghwensis]